MGSELELVDHLDDVIAVPIVFHHTLKYLSFLFSELNVSLIVFWYFECDEVAVLFQIHTSTYLSERPSINETVNEVPVSYLFPNIESVVAVFLSKFLLRVNAHTANSVNADLRQAYLVEFKGSQLWLIVEYRLLCRHSLLQLWLACRWCRCYSWRFRLSSLWCCDTHVLLLRCFESFTCCWFPFNHFDWSFFSPSEQIRGCLNELCLKATFLEEVTNHVVQVVEVVFCSRLVYGLVITILLSVAEQLYVFRWRQVCHRNVLAWRLDYIPLFDRFGSNLTSHRCPSDFSEILCFFANFTAEIKKSSVLTRWWRCKPWFWRFLIHFGSKRARTDNQWLQLCFHNFKLKRTCKGVLGFWGKRSFSGNNKGSPPTSATSCMCS